MIDLAIRGRRILTDDGFAHGAVLIQEGRISAVAGPNDIPDGVPIREAGDLAVIPAFVDTHVHVNEPGRT
ncbi:MAG: allantoinase, partial [Elusimicrobia bacterium]|nr:allantoinase [Elusimicrobiota bacterium]